MGFNLIYWTYTCGKYFLNGSFLEKCGKIWKNGRFSGRLRPDWGNTARADTAGLGSKGLTNVVSRVTLLSSYTADRISPFKLGALLQKDGDHKTSYD